MGIETLVLAVISIVAILMVLKFLSKFIMKIMGFAVILILLIAAMYYFNIWPFSQSTFNIVELETQFCDENQMDTVTCRCFIEPLKNDLFERFTDKEYKKISLDKGKVAYVFYKSLHNEKANIDSCLERYGEGQQLEYFIDKFTQVNISWSSSENLRDYFHEGIDTTKEAIKRIDQKYE